MGIIFDPVSLSANSGTEMMMRAIDERIDKSLSNYFSIGRGIALFKNHSTKRILWTHNLPNQRGVPESEERQTLSSPDRWNIIDGIVFVSEWQRNEYIKWYKFNEEDIARTIVLRNAIVPFEICEKPTGKIRLIYTSVPERGLETLYHVFEQIAPNYDIELEVFSSYKIYGIPNADIIYRNVLDKVQKHPKIKYHGTAPNAIVREAFKRSHIYAYPSSYLETSCISLIEGMASGCLCIHPDLGALKQTSAGYTSMYDFHKSKRDQAFAFEEQLVAAIENLNKFDSTSQTEYTNTEYSLDRRAEEWNKYLMSLL